MTNQPHREWVYRMAFEVGRHVIGYEVQKVRAAVGWFDWENGSHAVPIVVAGYGEGGLLALYSGALDTRIDLRGSAAIFSLANSCGRSRSIATCGVCCGSSVTPTSPV